MDKKLSAELFEDLTEMDEIVRSDRAPSREPKVGATAPYVPAAQVLRSLRERLALERARRR